MNDILNWYKSLKIKKRALVIKGLRQIGKTTIVKEFAKEYYENIVYINFMNDIKIKNCFNGDLNVDNLIKLLSANMPHAKFIPYKTIIIFDELQECVNARTSIKPFSEDGRFDIIATGSLIGLRGYNKKLSRGIPTGFEQILHMQPMDFEEFLWAKGINEDLINYIKECFYKLEPVEKNINEAFMNYYRDYLCVGGLPDVVNTYLSTYDMNQVNFIQKSILENYKDDFGKHLNENEETYVDEKQLLKIMEVYESIPTQLAKENKKFKYSIISKDAKAREYKGAIMWLKEFGLINVCYNLTRLELPLEGFKDGDVFKVYVVDTGLFMAMLDRSTVSSILSGDLGLYKGAIYENLVADALSKINKPLFYYRKDSGLEIDFVTTIDGKVTPLEVKATNGNSKSLKTILNNSAIYHVSSNYKLINGNVGKTNNINTIPYYMSFLLI